MNTFSSIAIESKISDLTRAELFKRLAAPSLHDRINNRGGREQFSALLLTHYYPNENIAKRKCRGTFMKSNVFYSKYND